MAPNQQSAVEIATPGTTGVPRVSTEYLGVSTPHGKDAPSAQDAPFNVNTILYISVGLVLLLPMQFGWSISQLNLSTFNSKDDCNARPVAEGTCLMFPGHSSGQWSVAVNGWTIGGMIGSLCSGKVADFVGRKKALLMNCIIMIAGSVVQASASTVFVLAVGRFISGIASGASTSIPNSFINEISPPHLRNRLGVSYQCSVGVGIVLVGLTFFFANTSSGWRYIAGFPIVLACLFLLGAPALMVESPTWLLTQGRRQEAEAVIARLYGQENVRRALTWMNAAKPEDQAENGAATPTAKPVSDSEVDTEDASSEADNENPYKALFSPRYRMQLLIAVVLALSQQLTGINAVFFYSSSLFQDAGLSDDRIGSIIVNVVNLLPCFGAGWLGTRFGNRNMLIVGHGIMLFAAVGITMSLVATISWLSIVFTAVYVFGFAISLGPLVFVVATSLFPNALRASGTSLCLFANWVGTLIVGIGYPHVADALGDWGFLPFIVTCVLFGLFMVKYLPETSGKTGEEIQEMFRTKNHKDRALV